MRAVPNNYLFKPTKSKLDSLFVSDVTVFDGTVMAPSARFTKIWKMRNNGTEAWTHKIRLFHIGGDKLSQSAWVTVGVSMILIYCCKVFALIEFVYNYFATIFN